MILKLLHKRKKKYLKNEKNYLKRILKIINRSFIYYDIFINIFFLNISENILEFFTEI